MAPRLLESVFVHHTLEWEKVVSAGFRMAIVLQIFSSFVLTSATWCPGFSANKQVSGVPREEGRVREDINKFSEQIEFLDTIKGKVLAMRKINDFIRDNFFPILK
ncbi:hypothetical protein NPIL_539291 [Nephila pilipes]|uniref:Uncharacterized protein n=1 Tax=Nephila pilipes TaxID=299642 RepID=A0A8X6NGD9_NEPPI|nr:hypothetical protein NPIL_539291 [Nephila pilipes]